MTNELRFPTVTAPGPRYVIGIDYGSPEGDYTVKVIIDTSTTPPKVVRVIRTPPRVAVKGDSTHAT